MIEQNVGKLSLPWLNSMYELVMVLNSGHQGDGVCVTRLGKLGGMGKNPKPLTDLEMELARVKRELAEVKIESD